MKETPEQDPARRGRASTAVGKPLAVLLAAGAATILFGFLLLPQEFLKRKPLAPTEGKSGLFRMRVVAGRPVEVPLVVRFASPLARLERLEMYEAPRRDPLRLRAASIELLPCGCRLEVEPGKRIGDGSPWVFLPPPGDCPQHRKGTESRAVLRIEAARTGEIGWLVKASALGRGRIRIDVPQQAKPIYAEGYWIWRPRDTRGFRLGLLAWMWGFERGAGWLGAGIAAAAGVLLLGLATFSRSRRIVLPVFLVALGLASVFALLVPPFQAPDEPDHLLAFAEATGNEDLARDCRRLARHSHFERIKFHPEETFTPYDRKEPFSVAWSRHVTPSPMDRRSPLTIAVWDAASAVVRTSRAAVALLSLRMLHAALFALAAAAGAWIVARATRRDAGMFPAFVFLIPTLPFFAMHASNHALFADLCVLAGCVTLAAFHREDHPPWTGPVVGTLAVLVVLTSYTAIPLLAWVLLFPADRLLRAVRRSASGGFSTRDAAMFWGGLALGGGIVAALWDVLPVFRTASRLMRKSFPALRSIEGIHLMVAALVAAGLLFSVELLIRRRIDRRRAEKGEEDEGTPAGGRRSRAAIAIVAVALFVGLIVSPFVPFDPVPGQTNLDASLGEYVGHVTSSLLTGLSFREPDYLLSITFWGGFGWLDTFLPSWIVRILGGAVGTGALLLLVVAARSGDLARLVRILLGAACLAGIGALTAFAAYKYQVSVHGRYLLGFYAIATSVGLSGFAAAVPPASPVPRAAARKRDPAARRIFLHRLAGTGFVAAAVALHLTTLLVILARYFR
jgi:hypothetical protein